MVESEKQLLAAWLRDAYALEAAKRTLMEGMLGDFKDGTDQKAYVVMRNDETHAHQETIAACLERIGEKPSKLKTAAFAFSGMMQGIASSGFQDVQVKDLLLLHSWGHFAHICYESLTHTAHRLDEPEIMAECLELGKRSRDLADYAREHIMSITDDALDAAAKKAH